MNLAFLIGDVLVPGSNFPGSKMLEAFWKPPIVGNRGYKFLLGSLDDFLTTGGFVSAWVPSALLASSKQYWSSR